MTTKAGGLLIDIDGDPKGFIRAVDKTERETDKAAKGMQASMTKAWGAIAGVVAAAGVVTAIRGMIDAAGDLELIELKFRAVFGDASESVAAWAASVSGDLQSTDTAIKKMVAGLQDLFVPLGFASDKALLMSKSVVQLAHDLAIFNGMKTADVLVNIQSALVGGHESVAKFGVIINEATLSQKLMTMGIDGGTKAATEQQKALARLNLIIGNTTAAHGQSASALDTYQGSVNALNSAVHDLQESLGTALLPTIIEVTNAATDSVKRINEMRQSLDSLGKTAGDMELASASDISDSIKVLQKSLDHIRDVEGEHGAVVGRIYLEAQKSVSALTGVMHVNADAVESKIAQLQVRLAELAGSPFLNVKPAGFSGLFSDLDDQVHKAKGKIEEIAASTNLLPALPDQKDTDAASKWLVDYRKRAIAASDASQQWSWETQTALDEVGTATVANYEAEKLIDEARKQHNANVIADLKTQEQATMSLAENGFRALSNAFQDGKMNWESFASSMLQQLPQILSQLNQMGGGTGGLGGGGFSAGNVLSGAGSILGFADGGSPPVGKYSLVGERGPELFMPQTAGTIIPAKQTAQILSGGGGTDNSVTINAPNADGQTIAHLRGLVYTLQAQLAGGRARERRFA